MNTVHKKILLKNKVDKYKNKFNNICVNNKTTIKTNSWFNSIKYNCKNIFDKQDIIVNKFDKIINDGYYTKKYKLIFNNNEKRIINRWMNSYIDMYNETVKHIKKKYNNNEQLGNISKIKKDLKSNKNSIHIKSQLIVNSKKIYISKHILDYAINDSFIAYKSCLTNLRNKFIKHFRLRKLKKSKNNKIIKIEKMLFNKNGFCTSIFKTVNVKPKIDNYVDILTTTSIIKKEKNNYYLLIKYKYKKNDNYKTDKIISIDPGLRVILTGISENEIVEIGTNVSSTIKLKLENIDRIKKNKINKKTNKKIKQKQKKLKNMIIDFHWKAANYLVKNYDEILIGNFSTKSMNENNINKKLKRTSTELRLYKLKEKIIYLCSIYGKKYKCVDEYGTTKTCSNCSYYKLDIGSNKIFNCNNCGKTLDRDHNSAKNILMKGAL